MSHKEATIEQLFRSHHARMFRLANTLLHDTEESKDAVSDVFAKLLQHDHLSVDSVTERYLLAAVRHRCLDIITHQELKRRVERMIPVDNVVSLSEALDEQRYQEILDFIGSRMPSLTQQVFRLRYDGHKTYEEIASQLSISQKTVYVHLRQAITRLHEHFNKKRNDE